MHGALSCITSLGGMPFSGFGEWELGALSATIQVFSTEPELPRN